MYISSFSFRYERGDFLFCFSYAVSDEFHQTFVIGRDGNFMDVLIDSGGVLFGIIISYALLFLKILKKGKTVFYQTAPKLLSKLMEYKVLDIKKYNKIIYIIRRNHMKLKIAIMSILTTIFANAASIDYLSNNSASYFQNPSQTGKISVEGIFYNPAGTTFLDDGTYINANLQNSMIDESMTLNGKKLKSL